MARCCRDSGADKTTTVAVGSQILFSLAAVFLLFPSTFMICFHHRPAPPCRALHCIALTHPNIKSRARMTLAVIGAFDACMQKAMCVARGWYVSWPVGIPQRRHSWTLIDKVFQGGRPRGSLGADDEVWSLQEQGLLVSPSQDRDSDSRQQAAHHILCGRYSCVQYRTVSCILAALSTGNVSAMRYHAMPIDMT